MIELSRRQLDFGDGLIAEEVGELWEDWMRHVDKVLDDPLLLDVALRGAGSPLDEQPHARAQGHPGRCRGSAAGAQAHAQLELRGARARGAGQPRVPPVHARSARPRCPMPRRWAGWAWRWGRRSSSRSISASWPSPRSKKIIRGRRMRVDTTVVETDIHYPTDASLLGDGVRVLTRAMKRIVEADRRMRAPSCATVRAAPGAASIQIGRAARSRGEQGKQRMAAVLQQADGDQPACRRPSPPLRSRGRRRASSAVHAPSTRSPSMAIGSTWRR